MDTPRAQSEDQTGELVARLVREGAMLKARGQLSEALERGVAAAERARATQGTGSQAFRASVNFIAGVCFDRGDLLTSRALFEWLSRTSKASDDGPRFSAIVDSNLSHVLLREGRGDEATVLLSDAFERLVSEDAAAAIQSMHGMATAAFDLGQFGTSAELHRLVLDVRREMLPADDPELATSQHNLAGALRRSGGTEEAAYLFGQAARIWRASHGDAHPHVFQALGGQAEALHALGRFDEAEPLYRRLIELELGREQGSPAVLDVLRSHLAQCTVGVALPTIAAATEQDPADPFGRITEGLDPESARSYAVCVRSFMARDYAVTVASALLHCQVSQRHDVMQFLMIALDRLCLDALLQRVTDWALKTSEGTAYQALLAHAGGRIEREVARRVAAQHGIEREHETYAACRASTHGDLAAAREMFARVSAHRPQSLEALLCWCEMLLRGLPVDAGAMPDAQQVSDFARAIDRLHAGLVIGEVQREIEILVQAGDVDSALDRARALSSSLEQAGDSYEEQLATSLNHTAHILYTHQRYEESLPYYERSLAVLLSHPATSPFVEGAARNNLGNLYRQLGRHGDAVAMLVKALEARRHAFGDAHPAVLLCLLDLAGACRAAQDPPAARARYREALQVALERLAVLKPFVQRLDVMVRRALAAGEDDAAHAWLQEALRIWETLTHERKGAYDLLALCRLQEEAGLHDQAKAGLNQALRLFGAMPVLDRQAVAQCLHALGRVELATGGEAAGVERLQQALELLDDEAEAQPLRAALLLALAQAERGDPSARHLEQALVLAEQAGDEAVQAAAWHLRGLRLRHAQSFDEARECFQRAQALRDRDDAHGRVTDLIGSARLAIRGLHLDSAQDELDHAETLIAEGLPVHAASAAICMHLRGRIAIARREHDAGWTILRGALERLARDAPSATLARASILLDLAPVSARRGEASAALGMLDEALAVFRNEAQAMDAGLALLEIAQIHLQRGALQQASDNVRQAHDLLVQVLAPEHVSMGRLWFVAGVINLCIGAHFSAESHLLKARRILGRAPTATPAWTAQVDLKLALLRHLEGRYEEALTASEQAATQGTSIDPADEAFRWKAYALAALGRKEHAMQKLLARAAHFADSVRRRAPALPAADRSVECAALLQTLGEVLTLAVDPALARYAPQAFATVQGAKAIEAQVLARQRDIVMASTDAMAQARWREVAELRSLIARTLLQHPDDPLSDEERRRIAAWEARIAALERDLFQGDLPQGEPGRAGRVADAADVAACLPEHGLLIEYVRFEPVDFKRPTRNAVDPANTARYCAFALKRSAPGTSIPAIGVFDLGPAADLEGLVQALRESIVERRQSVREHGAALRQRLLDPILAVMGMPTSLVVAADAALHAVPFDALTWTDGRWMLDVLAVSCVDVARDLLRTGSHDACSAPILIAAPDFDLHEGGDPQPSGDYAEFAPLAGAEREGRAIAAQLGVEPLLGAQALESALRRARSPRFLHLATHGFFIPDARDGARPDVFESVSIIDIPGEGSFIVDAVRPAADEDDDELIVASRLQDPLLRSGIVLAGANTWLAGGTLPVAAEDGVVTGLDVSGLDLRGTELVVLSACETGLGVADGRSGLVGLRQAFLLAGARTVVVTLWKVPDEATTDLMTDFYARLLAGDLRVDALRNAKLELRRRGYEDPVFWAAFTCVGDPSALEEVQS